MTGEYHPHRRPAEIAAGFASIVIADEDDLVERVQYADTRQLIASHWYDELEHPHLLESTVWLECFDESERSLHGQILISPLHAGPSDSLLTSIFQYLVMQHDQLGSTIPVQLRTDASERFELIVGTVDTAPIRIRTESHHSDADDTLKDAHQINLSIKLSSVDSADSTRSEMKELLRLWVAVQDCIATYHEGLDQPSVEIVIPKSEIEDEEMLVWQVLTKYESDCQLLDGSLPILEIENINVAAIVERLGGEGDALLGRALAQLNARKLESFGATGKRQTITHQDIVQTIDTLRST